MLKPLSSFPRPCGVRVSNCYDFRRRWPSAIQPREIHGRFARQGQELYAVDCAVCHGDNGNGKTDLATSLQVTLWIGRTQSHSPASPIRISRRHSQGQRQDAR